MGQVKTLPLPYFEIDQHYTILDLSQKAKDIFIHSDHFLSLVDVGSKEKAERFLSPTAEIESVELNLKTKGNPFAAFDVSISWMDGTGQIICQPVNHHIEKLAEQLSDLRGRLDQTNIDLLNKKEALESSQKRVNHLSGPLIMLSERLAFIPLFGDLTEEKLEVLTDRLLQQLNQSDYQHLLIDFTAVDEMEAEGLRKLTDFIQMVELLGPEPVISGLSPNQVQMVNGYEGFSSIRKVNSVQSAIKRFYLM
ncbi:STAS domain-containing protein [Gracilibacillus salinarum]|uniref:STAS domain-containing protein n=1 Tax=Gracilibacillus salinarum TaxID=2932255 RepID=A0ABY4GQC1_9BACI|nr:STAS domain-containing protein [Gracilibacillus salinarum]UOQ86434.1 STAS domain-containing protein [Gracilibacillus salinarum]